MFVLVDMLIFEMKYRNYRMDKMIYELLFNNLLFLFKLILNFIYLFKIYWSIYIYIFS